MNLLIIERELRRRHSLPDNFHFYKWHVGPDGVPIADTFYTQFWGVCCPLVTRGKRAGRPNWRAKDKTTERTFCITDQEADKIETEYETSTDKCRKCEGSGKEVARMDFVNDTVDYRQCGRCKGTGKPRQDVKVPA